MRELRPLEPGEIEEIGFSMDDEEYNKLLDDIEKLQSDEPVIVDGILFGTFGSSTEEESAKKPEQPKPDYNYLLSPWYGKVRKDFLKETLPEYKYQFYEASGLLQWHLIDINEKSFDMEEKLVAEIAAKEGVDGELKKHDQIGWVRRMNNIKNRAREIIRQELILVPTDRLCIKDIDESIFENFKA